MKTITKTPTKSENVKATMKVKQNHRTIYLSKFERYVINQSVEYWIKNAPKNPLENLLLDKFRDVSKKFREHLAKVE
jgi:hypothetical protein